MTEADWAVCTDPEAMFRYLINRITPRRRRLFAVACMRLLWDLLVDLTSRHSVEIFEQYADQRCGPGLFDVAFSACRAAPYGVAFSCCRPLLEVRAACAPALAADSHGCTAIDREINESVRQFMAAHFVVGVYQAVATASRDTFEHHMILEQIRTLRMILLEELWAAPTFSCCRPGYVFMWDAEIIRQLDYMLPFITHSEGDRRLCNIIRDIFNTYGLTEDSIPWLSPDVSFLAQEMYVNNCFDRMADLGGELANAGCEDSTVLLHCAGEGRLHYRGCWLVDLILSKDRSSKIL